MKTILTTILLMASVNAFAFPERDLDHMDLVDLTHSTAYDLKFTIQYPGLGNGGYQAEDCLALIVPKRYVKKEELEKFAKLIFLADGDGILFGHPSRHINVLTPEIKKSRRGFSLVFKLKDLGTYVTGLSITNYTIYATFKNSIDSAFGELKGTTALQFLRGCKL